MCMYMMKRYVLSKEEREREREGVSSAFEQEPVVQAER